MQAVLAYLTLDPFVGQALDEVYLSIQVNLVRMVASPHGSSSRRSTG